MIILQRSFRRQRVHHLQPRRCTERHRNRDRAIQVNHRRRRNLTKLFVKRDDPRPIRFLRRPCSRVAGRNLRLQHVRPSHFSTQLRSRRQRRKPTPNQEPVPLRAVLLQQQNRRARPVHTRPSTRRLYFHQRDQPMHLWLQRCQPRQHTPQPQRIFAQRRPQPIVTGGRRVSFIEDQINHRQHRRKPRRQLLPPRHLERNALFSKRALSPHNALRHGRLRHQKRPRNFLSGQTAKQAQR